ncbi:hypothetical protein CRE_09943 [Caenorhabditis remanei]|uniref:CCHC-type domain-containing protein n=1 Tax=Caenorhabditis remanei TaxID=31234 RepID=E3NUM8_CAERE|nr:hypothetical protein CRE_09943 [Caenorhabditis remanei]
MADEDTQSTQLGEIIRKNVEAMLGSVLAAVRQPEVAPKLSAKGLQKQADFNVKVANLLSKKVDEYPDDEDFKKIFDLIKARNAELELLDKDPRAAAMMEKATALASLTNASNGGISDPTQLMVLASLLPGDAGPLKRRRMNEPSHSQWFRGAGASRGESSTRYYKNSNTNGYGYQRFGHSQGSERARSQVCYKCHQPGHYASSCQQR